MAGSEARANELAVDGERLWRSLMEMAKNGATAKGGVCRLTLSDTDRAGRDLFVRWAEAVGCTVTIDRIGNIFAHRPGREDSLAPAGLKSRLMLAGSSHMSARG